MAPCPKKKNQKPNTHWTNTLITYAQISKRSPHESNSTGGHPHCSRVGVPLQKKSNMKRSRKVRSTVFLCFITTLVYIKFPAGAKTQPKTSTKTKLSSGNCHSACFPRIFFFFYPPSPSSPGLRVVHTFQPQLWSALRPVAAVPFKNEPHSIHSKCGITLKTQWQHVILADACARLPPQPVSQLLNTFKSTSCVLFAATGARNACRVPVCLSFFFSFFLFFLVKW